MQPTFANLERYKNKRLSVSLGFPPKITGGLVESHDRIVLADDGGNLALRLGDGADPGAWAYYVTKGVAVTSATGGETWLASGPYTGCEFILGKKKGGGIYAAHFARESGSTAEKDWNSRADSSSYEQWARFKVSPTKDVNHCIIIFADCAGGGPQNVSITRVEVAITNFGGSFDKGPMQIIDVIKLA